MSVPRPAAVIVLAAGEGTRMKSSKPKILHELCGRALVDHMLTAARGLAPERLIVVVGHAREQVEAHLATTGPDARAVVQAQQNGTGHAVRTVLESVGTIERHGPCHLRRHAAAPHRDPGGAGRRPTRPRPTR